MSAELNQHKQALLGELERRSRLGGIASSSFAGTAASAFASAFEFRPNPAVVSEDSWCSRACIKWLS